MNNKRSKIQGGWATNLNSGNRLKNNQTQKSYDDSRFSDGHCSAQPLTFEHVTLKSEPITRTISDPGEYVISTEPNAESKVILEHNFIDKETRKWMFEELKSELKWKQMQVRDHMQPRMTAWIGDTEYSYAGVTHQKDEWTPLLRMIQEMVEGRTGQVFNSVLANLYRDGHDSVAWHSDDERLFGCSPCIASVSFGDSRIFEMRRKPFGPECPTADLQENDYLEYIKVPLHDGSLLQMQGGSQMDWQHRLPREYHDRRVRINLTFRLVIE